MRPGSRRTGSAALRPSADWEASPVISGNGATGSVTHDQPSAIGRSKVTRSVVTPGSTPVAPAGGSSRVTVGSATAAGAALERTSGSESPPPAVVKLQRNGAAATPARSRKKRYCGELSQTT
ncbi:MAG: hypothetical protein BWX64_02836 [Acidobacteria bacterium ADurb.Bin051]|nr:MAG: hypothetical protein BWX64_02836 [Acidobacteria bacterium ADurb.Bin051]